MKCPVCGAELLREALFCGECGSSVTAKPKTRPLLRDRRPSDTTVLDPLPVPAVPGPRTPPTVPAVPSAPAVPAPPAPPAPPAMPGESAPDESAPDQSAPAESPGWVLADPPAPEPDDADGIAADAPVSFTLRMSTGERIVVSGTGLIGRRPIAQPGERPDQLVSVADTGRSVSKTHLEFGIQSGELWIIDRYSANGTSIVERSGVARRCEPSRRYRVGRGSRVEIGDQYIDVD
jgi:Predicted membrane protein